MQIDDAIDRLSGVGREPAHARSVLIDASPRSQSSLPQGEHIKRATRGCLCLRGRAADFRTGLWREASVSFQVLDGKLGEACRTAPEPVPAKALQDLGVELALEVGTARRRPCMAGLLLGPFKGAVLPPKLSNGDSQPIHSLTRRAAERLDVGLARPCNEATAVKCSNSVNETRPSDPS